MGKALGLAWVAVLLAGCLSLAPPPQSPAPPRPEPEPLAWTFVQMCDPQPGFVDYAADLERFSRAVAQINELKPDFVVICGDLVNRADRKSFADFNAVKARLRVPCYCAPGNHDVGDAPTPASLQFYRESIGPDYYAFEHKGCHFVVVNSQLWKPYVPGESERQEAWLKRTLAAAAANGRPMVVVGHIPLFAKLPEEPDAHDNLPREKRQELLSLFADYGVQLVLAGHAHRTLIREFKGVQMVAGETTSLNFDLRPFGFRLWRREAGRGWHNEFVALRSSQNQIEAPRPGAQPQANALSREQTDR